MQYEEPHVIPTEPAVSAHRFKKRFVLWVMVITVIAVAAVSLSILLHFDNQYRQAEALVNARSFSSAQICLEKIPSFYRDVPKLTVYAQAGEAFDAGRMEQARDLYGSLGEYKDSSVLWAEAYYRLAASLDAQNDFTRALSAYKMLGTYKDCPERLTGLREKIYQLAVDQYHSRKYAQAAGDFALVVGFERANDYLTLTKAHSKIIADRVRDYTGMKKLYGSLSALGTFEDTRALRESEPFFLFWLEGDWYCSSPGELEHIHIYFNAARGCWFLNDAALDDDLYTLSGYRILYMRDYCWAEIFTLKYQSETCLRLIPAEPGKPICDYVRDYPPQVKGAKQRLQPTPL